MTKERKDNRRVLKWVGYLTAIFSLCGTMAGVAKYVYDRAETRKNVAALLATEAEQAKAHDYRSGWTTLEKVVRVDPDSAAVRAAQEKLAMAWLEDVHLQENGKFSDVTEKLEPVLARLESPIRQAFRDAKWQFSDVNHVILVGGPTRMPVVRERFERILGRPAERTVDPMQCVALGAAIQGAVLSGDVKDIVLLDVTPLSLGVETQGGVFHKLIERNTTIPTKKSDIFTTAADGQTIVEVHVLQGERSMAADNISLGKFYLQGIPPAPRHMPQIEVTFDIDANGILNVSATDKATGKSEKLTIMAPQRMDPSKIDQAIRDAQSHAEDDRRRRELVETRNAGDALVYATEKLLKEQGANISEGTKKEVEEKVEALKKALTSDDLSVIRKAVEDLNTAAQKIGAEMYGKGGSAAPPPPAGGAGGAEGSGNPGDPGVVDADFEDVDKK